MAVEVPANFFLREDLHVHELAGSAPSRITVHKNEFIFGICLCPNFIPCKPLLEMYSFSLSKSIVNEHDQANLNQDASSHNNNHLLGMKIYLYTFRIVNTGNYADETMHLYLLVQHAIYLQAWVQYPGF